MNRDVLEWKAAFLREHIVKTALSAGKGHVAPALSWVEIAVTLFYGGFLTVRPYDPQWERRDRFILSKGHGCLTLYAVLADLGFFDRAELETFVRAGSRLAGHPDPNIPGIEVLSGSLGHGLGIGAGLCLGAQLDHRDWKTYVLLGDGECQEGSIWEAAAFASHHRLANLVAIVDRNHLGATDYTEQVMRLEPFQERWEAFGWEVRTVDGHSFTQLSEAFMCNQLDQHDRPLVILANTIKGKGLGFMEGEAQWHHRLPIGTQADAALKALHHREQELSHLIQE
ncbi:MAG: transketolase [Nitrospira sp.]|nr:transketolase [Nitrospira sp.]